MTAARPVVGSVRSRSTVGAGHTPSETTIHGLNPQREEAILALTGWPRLEPGTLNLEVPEVELGDPAWVEAGDTVAYPHPFTHIPTRRVAYQYYRGTIRGQDILVRQAVVAIPHRIELLAPVNLRKTLELSDGDNLTIRIHNGSQST
jgi:hypothetical protein